MSLPFPSRCTAFASAIFVVLFGACGGEASGPDSGALTVTLTTSRSTAAPGEAILATVRAEPSGDATVRWITIATTGLVEMRDSMAVTGPGAQEFSRTITLPQRPLTGQLRITGSASDGTTTTTDEETVSVQDGVAPGIVVFNAEPLPAQPGDSTHHNFEVTDAVGVSAIRLRIQSTYTAERTVTLPQSMLRATGIIKVLVPNNIPIGSNVTATLTAFDESGNSRESSISYSILDSRRPIAQLDFGGLHQDLTIGTGETAQITVQATDNHQLTWIGYEGGGRRDSLPVTGSSATRSFPVLVKTEWMQRRPVFSAWARDISGNLSVYSVGTLPVYDWTEHPKVIIPFPNEPTPVDVAWDGKRSVVYLLRSDLDRGLSSAIDVIGIPSGAVLATIPVPARVTGLSLTASGDSLVTTLPELRALGIVNLTVEPRSVTVFPLQYVDADRQARTARVSGSHVFVPFIHGLYPGRLLDVNLATGAQALRSDIGGTVDLGQYPLLLPLPGHRLLLHREMDTYSSNATFLYDVVANAFGPVPPMPAGAQFTASPSGRMILGDRLFNSAFTEIDSLAAQDWVGGYASALSLDGETAYLATWFGYQKVRVSDEFILEQVKLGTQPMQLLLLSTGTTLIGVGHLPGTNKGEYSLIVIDIR